jgi:hypothetical protein
MKGSFTGRNFRQGSQHTIDHHKPNMLLKSDSNPDIGMFQLYQPKRAIFRNQKGKSDLRHLTVNDMAYAGVKNHGAKEHLPSYFVKKWNNELEKP